MKKHLIRKTYLDEITDSKLVTLKEAYNISNDSSIIRFIINAQWFDLMNGKYANEIRSHEELDNKINS